MGRVLASVEIKLHHRLPMSRVCLPFSGDVTSTRWPSTRTVRRSSKHGSQSVKTTLETADGSSWHDLGRGKVRRRSSLRRVYTTDDDVANENPYTRTALARLSLLAYFLSLSACTVSRSSSLSVCICLSISLPPIFFLSSSCSYSCSLQLCAGVRIRLWDFGLLVLDYGAVVGVSNVW